IIVTDISKDGTLSGINQEMYKTLKENVSMNIIASGGVKSLEDVKVAHELGLYGIITGKAIYHGQLDLKEALAYVK
ncbi:MAG: 1-(5-phosphoribosyl)-5-((5-phosphoribosylamino)methylideneamino)imidazole-4-carboxamide isomerase, partial [Erysipelotrichaceae bacterium]|nr:1-(5-phosphoribosyl)-5-((5-phosphoribosylamino)methylideneamino)imidazole-4-carboxamide isomerase [Erysipelotrichaceae bacterium]